MSVLQLELTCRAASAGAFARYARSWLTEARTELFPELSRRLPVTAVLRRQAGDTVIGPPESTWADVVVHREAPSNGTSMQIYKPRAWQRLLDTLASVYPLRVRLMMTPLDEAGELVDFRAAASVVVSRDHHDPRWVRFMMSASDELVPWPYSARIQGEWTSFAETWASRLDVCYGHLTDDADDLYGSALEMATQTRGADPPTVPRCREVLRGYSWVTVCAPELARQLGGVRALTTSGAFHQVRELLGGQALLRATPLLEQYQGPAVERVFRVLAPVLLTGWADPERAPVGARLVLGADAADYQR